MSNVKLKPKSELGNCKHEEDNSLWKLRPMPEIVLIDPITGQLPKNYKQILSEKKKKSLAPGNQPSNKKKSLELKPMPELALIDPITGKLPKNYKQILDEKKNTVVDNKSTVSGNFFHFAKPTAVGTKPKLHNFAFKVSNVANKENISKKIIPDSTGQTNNKNNGARKVLFRDMETKTSRLSNPTKSRFSQIRKKTNNADTNDTIRLIELEESGMELLELNPKPKPRIQFRLNTPSKSMRKSSTRTSSSSMDEFLTLEQQCKTPKSIIKKRNRGNVPISDCQNHAINITKKINDIKRFHKEIEERHIMIQKNWNEITSSLNLIEETLLKNTHCSSNKNHINHQSQNSQSSIDSIANDTTLRISTMKKNLQRKILSSLNENQLIESPVLIKIPENVFKSMETPNTMIRTTRRIADEQYFQLRDTPKPKK